MVLAIEPMVNEKSHVVKTMSDGWTTKTVDGGLAAHFEHTIAIPPNGPVILTPPCLLYTSTAAARARARWAVPALSPRGASPLWVTRHANVTRLHGVGAEEPDEALADAVGLVAVGGVARDDQRVDFGPGN